jgi:hypothetical protein
MKIFRRLLLLLVFSACAWPAPAAAQTTTAPDEGWDVAIYPIFGWVPFGIGFDVNLPPDDGGGSGSGGGGGKIVDGRFDGAFLGGMSAAKGRFRVDADLLYAAVGGDRIDRPTLRVDLDAVYGHGSVGFELGSDVYVTGGIRRVALKYDIDFDGRQFDREPGIWDPLIGVAWHKKAGPKLDLHAVFEGGGFGVGADTDISTTFRIDWKPVTHFGLTVGYNTLYLKLENTVANKTFAVSQSMHGPLFGIGFYF